MKHFIVSILLSFSIANAVVAEGADLQLDIKVNGLVCDFCARAVEKVFKEEYELKGIGINLSEKLITVRLPAGTEISDEKIKELVAHAGYAFVSVERHEAGD